MLPQLFKNLRKIAGKWKIGRILTDYHLDIANGVQIYQAPIIMGKRLETIMEKNCSRNKFLNLFLCLSGFIEDFIISTPVFYLCVLGEDVLVLCRLMLRRWLLYFGSFNIGPAVRGSKIGEAAMLSYLETEAENHTIHADSSPDTPITQSYIGNYGFVGRGVKNERWKTAKRSSNIIVRNNQENTSYQI